MDVFLCFSFHVTDDATADNDPLPPYLISIYQIRRDICLGDLDVFDKSTY